METYLALIIMFLALILLFGLAVWREYVSSVRQAGIESGLSQIRTEQARAAAAISSFAEKLGTVFEGMGQLKEGGEKSAEFAQKAEQDLAYLKGEFALVTAYKRQAAQSFDHVEGL